MSTQNHNVSIRLFSFSSKELVGPAIRMTVPEAFVKPEIGQRVKLTCINPQWVTDTSTSKLGLVFTKYSKGTMQCIANVPKELLELDTYRGEHWEAKDEYASRDVLVVYAEVVQGDILEALSHAPKPALPPMPALDSSDAPF